MQYNVHTHNMYAHSPLWAPPKDWTGIFWDSQSHHRRLAVDGDVACHWKHNADKSRKMRAPVLSRGLKFGWVGFTTRNITNWSMIALMIFGFFFHTWFPSFLCLFFLSMLCCPLFSFLHVFCFLSRSISAFSFATYFSTYVFFFSVFFPLISCCIFYYFPFP